MGACTSTLEAPDAMGAPTSTGAWTSFFVKSLDAQNICVLVEKPYLMITYGDIKDALCKQKRFPVDKQRLILAGVEKESGRLVNDDNLQAMTCLHLVLKKK